VRTADDRLYLFAAAKEFTGGLTAVWTTAPGIPAAGAAFAGAAALSAPANVVSVAAAYDGGSIVHVLAYLSQTAAGPASVVDYPFDTAANAFRPGRTLDANVAPVTGASHYMGSSGIAAGIDPAGRLQLAYWSANNHVTHRAYTYNPVTDALSAVEGPTQLDAAAAATDGGATHPALAVSPLDGAVTVAWVAQASRPAQILARTRPAGGAWGPVEAVSAAPVWTSVDANGVHVDQGPSLLIGPDGARHLAYIETFVGPLDYGRVHYVRSSGAGWVDQLVPATLTHDPALAITDAGRLYLLGHGHPSNAACLQMTQLCAKARNPDGSWGPSTVVATPSGADSLDASVSVKWSAVGFYRPETVEFAFFSARNGSYYDTALYYGRLN
jgi:hypothetical protein